MLEAELTAHIGYEPYALEGRNSGNSRNGKRTRSLRTSAGDTTITVPRDRGGTFQSPLLTVQLSKGWAGLLHGCQYRPSLCRERVRPAQEPPRHSARP